MYLNWFCWFPRFSSSSSRWCMSCSTRTSPSIWWPTSFQPKELIGSDLKAFRSFPSRIPCADEGLVNLCRRNPRPRNSRPYDQGLWKPIGFPVSLMVGGLVDQLTRHDLMTWLIFWSSGMSRPGSAGIKGEDQCVISQIYPTYKYSKWKNPSIRSPIDPNKHVTGHPSIPSKR